MPSPLPPTLDVGPTICPSRGCGIAISSLNLAWKGPHVEGLCPACRRHVKFVSRTAPGMPEDLEPAPEAPAPEPPRQRSLF